MHLLGVAKIVLPKWEPDQGWRVLDPDGHQVDAGGKSQASMAGDLASGLARAFGLDGLPGTTPDEQRLLEEVARKVRM